MRRLLAFALFVGVALAACGDAPYTLETPAGIAGGKSLRYQKGVLTLQVACFEGEGVAFEAKTLRFDKETGEVLAEAPEGSFRGWRFSAERLRAKGDRLLFTAPRFSREGVVVTAQRAEAAGDAIRLEDLQAEAFGYRFRAREGTLNQDRFVARELFATPCQKGEALALLGERAVFDLGQKRLLVEESRVRYYGFCLARPRSLLLDLSRPLKLRSPLVFSLAQGVTFGVQELPLWEPGVPLGQERTRVTLIFSSLGSRAPRLRFGLSHPEGTLSLTVGEGSFALSLHRKGMNVRATSEGRGYLEVAPPYALGPWTLAPFAAVYTAPGVAEAHAGLVVRGRFQGALAGGRYTLEPRLRLALGPWAAYGARVSWQKGAFSFSLSGTGRLGGKGSAFPSFREPRRLAWELRYGPARAYYRYRFESENGRFGVAYRGAVWARVEKGLGTLSRRLELVAGLAEPTPRSERLAFAPELGYDFGLGRLSRAGLTVAYGDGCLVYRLRMRYLFAPWPGEAGGFGFSMGVALS